MLKIKKIILALKIGIFFWFLFISTAGANSALMDRDRSRMPVSFYGEFHIFPPEISIEEEAVEEREFLEEGEDLHLSEAEIEELIEALNEVFEMLEFYSLLNAWLNGDISSESMVAILTLYQDSPAVKSLIGRLSNKDVGNLDSAQMLQILIETFQKILDEQDELTTI